MKKNCIICGKEFDAETNGIGCSKECKKQRQRERMRQWRQDPANRELMRALARKYRRAWLQDPANREVSREQKRQWLQVNRERARDYQRQWLQDPSNKERERIRNRDFVRKKAPISTSTQKFFLAMKLGEAVNQQNETMKTSITIVPSVQQFIESFLDKLKGIEASCVDLAKMVDADPDVFDKIVAADSRFNYNMLESMRKVGKGELYCELLFDPSLAARKLLPLPPAQQKKLYNEPIQVVKLVAGKQVVESKALNKLSRHELTLVIDEDKGRARTIEEQIAFVQPPAPSKRAERYQIVGDRLKVLAETEFTAEQLRTILERMDKAAVSTLQQSMKKNQVK